MIAGKPNTPDSTAYTGKAHGVFTLAQQIVYKNTSLWTAYARVPDAPTIGTATVVSNTSVSVSFTPPSPTYGTSVTYTVVSSGGQFATGASSPITVTGLTTGTPYTFTVTITNSLGTSASSAASNSATPVAATNPPVSGYVGWYTAASFVAGTRWTDLSGNGNHATTLKGSPSTQTQTAGTAGNSLSVSTVYGGTSDGITWPTAILPATYTLFHVARQTASSPRARIFDGVGVNWLSGFWNGTTGQAYHSGWLTDASSDPHGLNWFVSTDQNSLYRSAGIQRSTSVGGTASAQLSILSGVYAGEASNWAVAEVVVYNRTLTLAEIQSVETYLSSKYGL